MIKEINRSAEQENIPVINSTASEGIRMKAENEYGGATMGTESASATKHEDGQGVEKMSEIYNYNNYEISDFYNADGGQKDPNLQQMKKILKDEDGEICEVIIKSYCYIADKPGTKYPLDPDEKKHLSDEYKAVMNYAGVGYKGAKFNVSAYNVKSAGENDGGCLITVQFKYTSFK
jgi:hypothetical protein